MKYKIEVVTTKEQLNKLYNSAAFTMEGLNENSIPDLMSWLEQQEAFITEEPVVYITKGSVMNENYHLNGNNIYPKHITIVSVIGINQIKIAIKRFEIGARWFDDIVENKILRERGV